MQHGDFTHFELPADDLDRAVGFYRELFGWGFQTVPGFDDYHMFTTPAGEEGMGGGIGIRDRSVASQLRTYVHVDSVDGSLQKVTELGGSVVLEKQEIPGMGWYAVFRDTEGNEMALYESSRQT